jgi:hypothetical protein
MSKSQNAAQHSIDWTLGILRNFQSYFGSRATGFEPLPVLLMSRVRAWGDIVS